MHSEDEKDEVLRTPEDDEAGMTIIEILIVIALIGTIMSVVISSMFPKVEEAKIKLTSANLANISTALQHYKMNNNNLPSTEEGLQALVEKTASAKQWTDPYIEEEKLKDAWDNAITYEKLNNKEFLLRSPGPDGETGNEDDILYPKAKSKKED